jgi:hypothetical protein
MPHVWPTAREELDALRVEQADEADRWGLDVYLDTLPALLSDEEYDTVLGMFLCSAADVASYVPVMNRLRPQAKDVCRRILNMFLNLDTFRGTAGFESEYVYYALLSFVTCRLYAVVQDGPHPPNPDGKIRRTQCMYCLAGSACMNADTSRCSTDSPRMRCEVASQLHLCNACGLRAGISVDRDSGEDLVLTDGRVIPKHYHLAKIKKKCSRYCIKGKRNAHPVVAE